MYTAEQLRKRSKVSSDEDDKSFNDEEAYIIFSTVLIFMTARAWDVFIKTLLTHYGYNTIPYEFLFAILMTGLTYYVIKKVLKKSNITKVFDSSKDINNFD